MSNNRSEPVRHTCPDIDRIISTIKAIVKQMDSCDSNDKKADIIDLIRDWSSDLADIGIGYRCSLEELRESNNSLRNWGNELVSEIEEFENKYYALDKENNELLTLLNK